MGKILIVAGHGMKPNGVFDPGAVANGITEAGFIRDYMIAEMKKYNLANVDFLTDKDMYSHDLAKSISGYSEVVELHMDSAANTTASGGHVIIHKRFKPDAMDKRIRDVVKKHVGLAPAYKEGFSYRDDLKNLNVFANRGINYRLVELGFISNQKDVNYLKVNYKAVAKELLEAITGQKLTSDGWVKENSKWYYYVDGKKKTGWIKDKGKWYFLDSNGVMQTGWIKDKSKWYYLNKDGSMATGWVKDKNKWYYLGSDGAMVTGLIQFKGKWYYLKKNGEMLSDTTVHIDKDGVIKFE